MALSLMDEKWPTMQDKNKTKATMLGFLLLFATGISPFLLAILKVVASVGLGVAR